MVAKRIKLGKRTELPLYALGGYILSGGLLFGGAAQEFGMTLRAPMLISAIIAFLAGAVVHTFDKIDQHSAAMLDRINVHNSEMLGKIDASVGGVWEAGERAGERQAQLKAQVPKLAVVHDLSPR